MLPAGFLASSDRYMNLQLASTEEWVDGTFSGNLGEVLIRCAPAAAAAAAAAAGKASARS